MGLNDAGRYKYEVLTDTNRKIDGGVFWVSSSENFTPYEHALAHCDEYRNSFYKVRYWREPDSVSDIVNRRNRKEVEIALW